MAAVPGTSASAARPHNPGPIMIPRDYTLGEQCQFSMAYPADLHNKVQQADFEQTIKEVNRIFGEAERLGMENFTESLVGCLSCFTSYMCITTHYETCMQKLKVFLEAENERVYERAGLQLRNPLRNGLQYIEIARTSSPLDHIV